MHMMKTAPQAVAVKAREDGGMVAGYAATFDRIRDSYGDVIKKGAFAESLERWKELNGRGVYIPLLYGHQMNDPRYNIGKVTLAREDEKGLYIEAEIDPESDTAQYVRRLVAEGRLYQFSFAFDVLDAGEVELEDGSTAYELRKLELFEVSLVQIPANPRAEVTDVKSGRMLSKTNEDGIREAIGILQGILDRLPDEEERKSAENGDEEGDSSAGDPVEEKGALVADRIARYIN